MHLGVLQVLRLLRHLESDKDFNKHLVSPNQIGKIDNVVQETK